MTSRRPAPVTDIDPLAPYVVLVGEQVDGGEDGTIRIERGDGAWTYEPGAGPLIDHLTTPRRTDDVIAGFVSDGLDGRAEVDALIAAGVIVELGRGDAEDRETLRHLQLVSRADVRGKLEGSRRPQFIVGAGNGPDVLVGRATLGVLGADLGTSVLDAVRSAAAAEGAPDDTNELLELRLALPSLITARCAILAWVR